MWIWPLSAIEHTHWPAGGWRRIRRNADGSALFWQWIAGPRSLAAGWFGGHGTPSSRYAIDHRRRVSGGRPVIDHEHPTHSHGEERAIAWSWSVKVSVMTSSTLHAWPSIVAAHQ